VQPGERPLPQHFEQRSKWLESLGYLAAGDGAVLVDSRVKILGFGAFIDVPEAARQVTCFSYAGGARRIESTKLGGGRHRSAIEFCVRFAPAATIVVSEDGRISIVWAETKVAPCYAPFSALGISSDSII
jgi:DNA integrity scanning protein DisA with diadenylate cyclase activity